MSKPKTRLYTDTERIDYLERHLLNANFPIARLEYRDGELTELHAAMCVRDCNRDSRTCYACGPSVRAAIDDALDQETNPR